jgi:hypothetical protein
MSSKSQALQFGSSSTFESNGDNSMAGLNQNDEAKSIVNTGGGVMVEGDVHPGGDFIGRDQVQVTDNRVRRTKTNNYFNLSNTAMPSITHLTILAMVGMISIVALAFAGPLLYSASSPAAPSAVLPTNPTPLSAPVPTPSVTVSVPLQAITFRYTDDPTNHGWRLTESQAISYTHPSDAYYEYTLGITAIAKYALSFDLKPTLHAATRIEAIVKLDKNALFYVLTALQRNQGEAPRKMWFKFKVGVPSMKSVEGKTDEWQIVMAAEPLAGGWQKLDINLTEVIAQSVGKDGWRLGQVQSVRVRGNLSLASIAVYP